MGTMKTVRRHHTGLALATLALLTIGQASAGTPTCSSALADDDGDGWGWENNQTCRVVAVSNHRQWPACRFADSDSDGDGYGWENEQSCVVGVAPPASSNHPLCQRSDSDSDGDGWGWENQRSCIVGSPTDPDTAPATGPATGEADDPVCASAASDPDGDGWGWEDGQSCRVDATAPATSPATGGADDPVCASAASDPDGDGWGYENGRSCTVADGAPDQSGQDGDDAGGYGIDAESGLPICLTTASDPLGSGYGYEFGRSCKVVAGRTNTPDNPLYNTEFCASWAELAYGDYRLQNNTWNAREVYRDDWSQCIELRQGSDGSTVPVWRFDWLERHDGDQAQVKSYPQVYYGRKNQWNFSGSPEQLGLPRELDALDRFTVEYAFSTRGDAEYNVALESFFHTSCDASERNKQFELMVWVGVPGEKTPGTQVTSAYIDGVEWKVYANPSLSWGYVAFVAPQTTPSGRLDWNAFIDWSRANASSLGLGSLENTCMGAIEIGTETFWGELEFRLDRFEVSRR